MHRALALAERGRYTVSPNPMVGCVIVREGAVIAEGYERIHRSNLIGMGVLPLQFRSGDSAQSLGLTGEELFDVIGLAEALGSGFSQGKALRVVTRGTRGRTTEFEATVRIDTPQEPEPVAAGGD